jgi:hypothetical protein
VSTVPAEVAMRRRTIVWLNLGELERLLGAALDAGAANRHAPIDLARATRRVERARNRRLRAVRRAGGK